MEDVERWTPVLPLGAGAFGEVHLAWDRTDHRWVALKRFTGQDELGLLRFVIESRIRVSHPHLVRTLAFRLVDDRAWLVTELARGGSLRALMASHGALPAGWVAEAVDQVLRALEALHATGVVHRDLKPANLLLRSHGTEPPHLLVGDFGIATLRTVSMTGIGAAIGTPGYLAPEYLDGHQPSPATDLFAVGVLAAELLTGRRLVHYSNASPDMPSSWTHTLPLPPSVPTPLGEVLARMAAPDPARRYTDCAQAREALLRAAPAAARDDLTTVPTPDLLASVPPGWTAEGPETATTHLPAAPTFAAPLIDGGPTALVADASEVRPPNAAAPQAPGTATPQAPNAAGPSTAAPQAPGTAAPQAPGAPGTATPQAPNAAGPSTAAPQAPGTAAPQAPGTAAPQVPSAAAPSAAAPSAAAPSAAAPSAAAPSAAAPPTAAAAAAAAASAPVAGVPPIAVAAPVGETVRHAAATPFEEVASPAAAPPVAAPAPPANGPAAASGSPTQPPSGSATYPPTGSATHPATPPSGSATQPPNFAPANRRKKPVRKLRRAALLVTAVVLAGTAGTLWWMTSNRAVTGSPTASEVPQGMPTASEWDPEILEPCSAVDISRERADGTERCQRTRDTDTPQNWVAAPPGGFPAKSDPGGPFTFEDCGTKGDFAYSPIGDHLYCSGTAWTLVH